MTPPGGLSEYLLARIAEEEALVRAGLTPDPDLGDARTYYATAGAHRDDWGLWTFHVPPQHVLAECDAKRRLIELHHPSTTHQEGTLAYCVGCWEAGGEDGAPSHPCATLRALGTIYAHRGDYREEWRA